MLVFDTKIACIANEVGGIIANVLFMVVCLLQAFSTFKDLSVGPGSKGVSSLSQPSSFQGISSSFSEDISFDVRTAHPAIVTYMYMYSCMYCR